MFLLRTSRVSVWGREPLLHFLLIGAALFLLYGWRAPQASGPGGQAAPPTTQIIVTRDALDQMKDLFIKTWQRPPTGQEQEALLEEFIRNEIYYREALAIGLDRDDEVLKRRLRQRMEFIYEDISTLVEPTDEELRMFLEKHRQEYLIDPQVSFRQVYISADRRRDDAESVAGRVLAQLAQGAAPGSVGDPTLLPAEIELAPLWEVRKQFGDEFSEALLSLTPGEWAEPIRSGFGQHLVFVKEHVAGRLPDLAQARETLKRDWMAEKQREVKDAAYAKIRERYRVTVERRAPATAPSPALARTEAFTR